MYFTRPEEGKIPGGGMIVYPAGNFEEKFKHIEFFKAKTALEDIRKHLLKVTRTKTKTVRQEELGMELKNIFKEGDKMPVLLIDDKGHHGDKMGFRYMSYDHRIDDHFRFLELMGDKDQLV